ncbi:hypothetical protein BC938DRAFT_482839 [Jimgerdemannia flammicorona]|uniref:Uncharacterized protein n=1 Tax=Jimgerdemannia flammicorona TaxID=994334 RepID=A0A433QD40_9FUNG|nr:hypothetical protein BC938DRAFT_482839 [Jimgerdemannia flammicorona]
MAANQIHLKASMDILGRASENFIKDDLNKGQTSKTGQVEKNTLQNVRVEPREIIADTVNNPFLVSDEADDELNKASDQDERSRLQTQS